MLFSVVSFKIFLLLALVFRSLIMMDLGVDFFEFILLRLAQLLEYVGLCISSNFNKFGMFSAIILLTTLSPPLLGLQHY